MANHLQVLAKIFKATGLTQADVAKHMYYKSPSMISMVLRGERGMGLEELMKMCDIAGITLAELASKSDDLKLTETTEALEAASIIDALPGELRQDALDFIKGLAARNKHKPL